MATRNPQHSNDEIMAAIAPLLEVKASDLNGYVIIGFRNDDNMEILSNSTSQEATITLLADAIRETAGQLAWRHIMRRQN